MEVVFVDKLQKKLEIWQRVIKDDENMALLELWEQPDGVQCSLHIVCSDLINRMIHFPGTERQLFNSIERHVFSLLLGSLS